MKSTDEVLCKRQMKVLCNTQEEEEQNSAPRHCGTSCCVSQLFDLKGYKLKLKKAFQSQLLFAVNNTDH